MEEIDHRLPCLKQECRIVPDRPCADSQRNQKRQHEQFSHHGEDEPQDQGGNQAGDDKRVVWNVSLLNAVSAIITSPPQGGFLMARDVSSP